MKKLFVAMETMKMRTRALVKSEKGQGMVEYGLILAVIAVVAVVAFTNVGSSLLAKMQSVNTSLGGTN